MAIRTWATLLFLLPTLVAAQELRRDLSPPVATTESRDDADHTGERQMREALAGVEAAFKEEAELSKRGRFVRSRDTAAKANRLAEARERERANGVRLGMGQEQVRASSWGNPICTHRMTGSDGKHEQWVYAGDKYLYFRNGLLSTIQN